MGQELRSDSSKGVRVTRFRLKKRLVLFGKRVWKKDYLLALMLPSIDLMASYSSVPLIFEYDNGDVGEGHTIVVTDPSDPACDHLRRGVEMFVHRFTKAINNLQAEPSVHP